MKRLRAFMLANAVFAAACSGGESPTQPTSPELSTGGSGGGSAVHSNADAGPGSLRQAVLDANANPSIASIRIRRGIGAIALRTPITYTGAQGLTIDGGGAELVGTALAAGEAALIADGGGDLTLRLLGVTGAPGNGITVAVPVAATGTISIHLDDVTIRGNQLHGVLVNDQAEYFTDPNSVSAEGSDASVRIQVSRSRIVRNGLGALDYDGLRINEGGRGRIDARISDSEFLANGADGVELDERGAGDTEFLVVRTRLERNGSFSTEDLDDGIDVDESGAGDIVGRFRQVTANDNSEQGVDLNENDAGDLRIEMFEVEASGNGEEGIEFEEDDDFEGGGNIVARLVDVTTNRNGALDGDAGLKLREKGPGNLSTRLVRPRAAGNSVGGILVQEDSDGELDADLSGVAALRNGDDGIKLEENGGGNLRGTVLGAVASGNAAAGVALAQELPGAGEARIRKLTAENNADGPIVADGVVVTGP